MSIRIAEQAAFLAGNGVVDRTNKMIRNVKLCGLESRNGRRYAEDCLAEVASRMVGRRIFVDHVDDPKKRNIRDRSEFARLVSCAKAADGLRGDLKYFESCAATEHILEIIEDKQELPQDDSPYTGSIGLSPVWFADTKLTSGQEMVYKIHEIESVDIVTFPATTRSIREHIEDHRMNTWKKYAEGIDEKLRPAFLKLMEEMGMDAMAPMASDDHTEDLMAAIKKLLGKGDNGSMKMAKKIFAMLTKAGVTADDEPEEEDKIEEEYDEEEEEMNSEEKKAEESAAAELAKERKKNQVLMECLQAGYKAEEDDLDALCEITSDAVRTKWIKESASGQRRKGLRSESASERVTHTYKTEEQIEKDAIDNARRRIKEDFVSSSY